MSPFAKFIGHRLCDTSYTAAKIFYVTFKDHAIKKSGEGNFSLYIFSHRHCVHRNKIILVCQMILQNQVIIWQCDFMVKSHSL